MAFGRRVRGPIRGGPFPILNISWDPKQIGMTAGEVGRVLLDGEPRIMSQAEGDGHSFVIRPVAMKSGEHKIVARRLREIFSAQRSTIIDREPTPPALDISGAWDVEIRYQVGSARHKLFLAERNYHVAGSHEGWATQGDL